MMKMNVSLTMIALCASSVHGVVNPLSMRLHEMMQNPPQSQRRRLGGGKVEIDVIRANEIYVSDEAIDFRIYFHTKHMALISSALNTVKWEKRGSNTCVRGNQVFSSFLKENNRQVNIKKFLLDLKVYCKINSICYVENRGGVCAPCCTSPHVARLLVEAGDAVILHGFTGKNSFLNGNEGVVTKFDTELGNGRWMVKFPERLHANFPQKGNVIFDGTAGVEPNKLLGMNQVKILAKNLVKKGRSTMKVGRILAKKGIVLSTETLKMVCQKTGCSA